MGFLSRGFVLTLATLAWIPIASCLDPTEIDVVLQTDVDPSTIAASGGALVRVGTPSNVDTTPSNSFPATQCDDAGNMGDFYVVPSGSIGDVVAIDVELGVDVPTNQCDPAPNAGCIYARRELSFLPHSRVLLPIRLDQSCLGKVCPQGQTCDQGSCTGDVIDPTSCDGGGCNPIDDSGAPDVPVIVNKDATPDVTVTCLPPSTMCGGNCVDLTNNTSNCGACNFDCGSGHCLNGTCVVGQVAGGVCLAVSQAKVYVASTANVTEIATSGGIPNQVASYASSAIAASTDVLAYQASQPPSILDITSQKTTPLGDSVGASFLAASNAAFAFIDSSGGRVYYAKLNQTQAPYVIYPPYTSDAGTAKIPGWVAVMQSTAFLSINQSSVCVSNAGASAQCYNVVTEPGPIAVSDPTSASADVFVVSGGSKLVELGYTATAITSTTPYAAGADTLTAITSDGTSVYAIGTNGQLAAIEKTSGTSFTMITNASNALENCIAVDDAAVYWLDASGYVYRHIK